jgi:hypothetical protein
MEGGVAIGGGVNVEGVAIRGGVETLHIVDQKLSLFCVQVRVECMNQKSWNADVGNERDVANVELRSSAAHIMFNVEVWECYMKEICCAGSLRRSNKGGTFVPPPNRWAELVSIHKNMYLHIRTDERKRAARDVWHIKIP